MVTATEFERWRVDPATLKQVSGGDLVPHQPKFEAERTSPVRATLILSGNSLPYLGLFDPAVVERFRLVPFPKPDNDFSKILELFLNRDEAASKAMLRLLVDYARAYPPGKRIDVPTSHGSAIDDASEAGVRAIRAVDESDHRSMILGIKSPLTLWNAGPRIYFARPAKDMIDGSPSRRHQSPPAALQPRCRQGRSAWPQTGRAWSGDAAGVDAPLLSPLPAQAPPRALKPNSDIESIQLVPGPVTVQCGEEEDGFHLGCIGKPADASEPPLGLRGRICGVQMADQPLLGTGTPLACQSLADAGKVMLTLKLQTTGLSLPVSVKQIHRTGCPGRRARYGHIDAREPLRRPRLAAV